ncbi:hypothetical protein SAMN04489738_2682 [Pseudarthrobacter chlorophenolicus]|nr:hypothetical protein SAMN04489738_2682 [Pseudarthrobacter chlorophenolicus]
MPPTCLPGKHLTTRWLRQVAVSIPKNFLEYLVLVLSVLSYS